MDSRLPPVLTLIGAYGREATTADWEAGLDFKVYNGPYTSKRDVQRIREAGVLIVQIKNRKGQVIKIIDLRAGCL